MPVEALYHDPETCNGGLCGRGHIRGIGVALRKREPGSESPAPVLRFSADEWEDFIVAVKAGAFDLRALALV
jgi:hypothetical protein